MNPPRCVGQRAQEDEHPLSEQGLEARPPRKALTTWAIHRITIARLRPLRAPKLYIHLCQIIRTILMAELQEGFLIQVRSHPLTWEHIVRTPSGLNTVIMYRPLLMKPIARLQGKPRVIAQDRPLYTRHIPGTTRYRGTLRSPTAGLPLGKTALLHGLSQVPETLATRGIINIIVQIG